MSMKRLRTIERKPIALIEGKKYIGLLHHVLKANGRVLHTLTIAKIIRPFKEIEEENKEVIAFPFDTVNECLDFFQLVFEPIDEEDLNEIRFLNL
jgi:hypothetical protein